MAEKTKKNALSAKEVGLTPIENAQGAAISFATAVRVLLQNNWRQGTVACKGRSDVNRTNKKPWKQKGTGRARAGTARSPLWRGGGVTFGPQPRVRELKISSLANRLAMKQLAWDRLGSDAVVPLEVAWPDEKPKTAVMQDVLVQAGLAGKRVAFFVAPHDYRTQASLANIPKVQVLYFDQPNAYDLANGAYWVFLKGDSQLFKDMVAKWN